MEEEKMVNVSSTVVAGKISPPAIHLSPSRQSSSSTDHEPKTNTTGVGTTVAKKKRELFSARSSRSGGSNQSSASDLSREQSFGSISKVCRFLCTAELLRKSFNAYIKFCKQT